MGLELGTKIRQLRKFSGMTQEQLAEKLHVSGRHYRNGKMIRVCLTLRV